MRVLLILLTVLFLVDGGHLQYGHASQSRRQTKLQPRIVGGTAATPNRFPYHSLLTIYTNDGMQYMCSGTLVRQDMVVTAAHCTGGLDEEVQITRITAAVNFTSVFRSDKQYSHQRKVVEVINHKRWESATNRNDVSLMILESPVPDDVTPISINFDNSVPADHTVVSAMGMGLLQENGVSADTLQVVDVNIIPFDACSAHEPYDQVVWDKKMICASSPGRVSSLMNSINIISHVLAPCRTPASAILVVPSSLRVCRLKMTYWWEWFRSALAVHVLNTLVFTPVSAHTASSFQEIYV